MTPWWRPDRHASRRPLLLARNAMTAATRRFFAERGFVEVETPALQASPGMEVHLKAFRTALESPQGGARALYLHTSPEFAMKKLLAAGERRIFQLARVFRNGERAATHHPEFTMLEWYRADAAWTELMADCEDLVRAVSGAASGGMLHWQGTTCDPRLDFERLSVAEAFRRHAGLDVLGLAADPRRFAEAARGIGIACPPQDRWDDIFFRVFLDRIEPKLGVGRPTLLHSYPAAMAALARIDARDPRVCERFELYVCGLELANAFGELTDAGEQRRRFEADMALKQALYGERYPIDEDFLAAVAAMPPASGIALGFDRLVMLATGAIRIEDVLWAPVADGERT